MQELVSPKQKVNPAFTMLRYAARMIAMLPKRLMLRLSALLFLLLGMAAPAYANVTFTMTTGNSATNTQALTIDSNKCPIEGPTSAYVGGILTNTSGSELTNVVATISGLNANVFLAGNQPASQTIGTMAAGETIAVYWFVGYSCATGATATPTVTASSDTTSTSTSLNLFIRDAISAAAGGNVISSTLGPGAVVGQTIFFDAEYDFGGTDTGDEYFLQPTGSQIFDAECFRLVRTEITASNLNAAPVGTVDQLYLIQPNKQAGNNKFITVRYFFEYLCAGASTDARPYAVQTSGTQIKYTGNFDGAGSISISFPPATNPFTISKSISQTTGTTAESGNLTYTVTISNPSVHDAIMGEIVDILPDGMTFVGVTSASEVTAANSSSLPAAGSTGTIRFVGRRGQSYSVPGGGSISLVYEVTRPADTGSYTNSAQGVFGQATTATAQATFTLTNPVQTPPTLVCPIGESVFRWINVDWPRGSLNNSFPLADLGTIGFDITNEGSFVPADRYGGDVPGTSATMTGGYSDGGASLIYHVDRTTRTQQSVTTIDLPQVFTGVQFEIFDVDSSSGFQDRVTVYGLRNGVRVDAVLSGSQSNFVVGDTALGDGGSTDTQSFGNVTVTFTDPIDTIIFEYGNGSDAPADPTQQGVGLHDFTFCIPQLPVLSVSKVSSVIADPINGTNDPKAIPGATVEYLITVANSGSIATDADSVIVWDDGPADAKMCLISRTGGPAIFADPGSNSGLTYSFATLAAATDDIEFSNDDGATFTYTPSADADGCDTAITDFRVNPDGAFASGGNFTITVRYIVE